MLAYEKELRKDLTESALREIKAREVKLALIPVATELGLDTISFEKLSYENGQIMHLIKVAIHELRSVNDLLQKRVKRLQKQRDNDHQLVLNFIKGEKKANETRN